MRIICHLFFIIFACVLFEIQISASEGNDNDIDIGNEAIIDTKLVEEFYDSDNDDSEDIPIHKKQRSNGMRNFVGTNLFYGDGTKKTCFSSEDIALLAARRDFEFLIPDPLPKFLLDDELAQILMQYFNSASQIISQMTVGPIKAFSQKAFSDTLGGYLQYYLAPLAMYSYYAGLIKLRSVEDILELYEQNKMFLNTNGNGWLPPINNFSDFGIEIDPLRIIVDKDVEEATSCSQLIMADDETADAGEMIVSLPRLEPPEDGILGNIWLPFKRKCTFNLQSSDSAFVLLRYFELTTRCYSFQGLCQKTFNEKFKHWMTENLENHFQNDIFYPGLGAFLRVLETLKPENNDFVVLQKRQKTQDYKILETNARKMEREQSYWMKDFVSLLHKFSAGANSTDCLDSIEAAAHRRAMYCRALIVCLVILLVFVVTIACIIKWSSIQSQPDIEKQKEKKVRIDESHRYRPAIRMLEDEITIDPESSSVVSSPPNPTKKSSSCFPLCTKKNSLEFDLESSDSKKEDKKDPFHSSSSRLFGQSRRKKS